MSLLFVTALILLIHILWKAKTGYEFQAGKRINHLLFTDVLKLYSKSEMVRNSLIQAEYLTRILEFNLDSNVPPW